VTRKHPDDLATSARRVALLVFPEFQILDLAGPLAVLDAATHLAAERGWPAAYEISIVAATKGAVSAAGPVVVQATHGFTSRLRGLDTFIVVGGDGVQHAARDARLVGYVRQQARKVRRVASVCTGAFILAAAGLLDHKRAATHWAYTDKLAELFRDTEVDREAIYVTDGAVHTSAGVTAGIDLTLSFVESDFGRELALAVARHLVVPLHRAGGQAQLSVQLQSQVSDRDALQVVRAFVLDHITADLSVAVLAQRAGMSPRNFARVFRTQLGMTPASFVVRTRLEVARRLLEQTTHGMDQIAQASGLGSTRSLQRAFVRALGMTPEDYRASRRKR